MKKFKIITVIIFIVVLSAFFALVLPGFLSAKNNGKEIGSRIGNTVGTAVGSLEGVASGTTKGTKAGEEQGKSAEDTEIDYVTKISKIGKLEVLTADLKAEDVHTYGDDSKENVPVDVCKYAAIRVYEGTGVFSVDLEEAEIKHEENTIIVNIPYLEVDIFVDDSKTETLTEWKSNFFDGDAKSGFDVEGNTDKIIREKLLAKLADTAAITEQAENAAENQVSLLVKAMSKNDVTVKVNIIDSNIKYIENDSANETAEDDELIESEG